MPLTDSDTAGETFLFCPACGYDLRASTDGRCNECGLAIDRASLRVSAFPWAHRREMGRVRAYVRTVWQVLVGNRALAYETVKPQDPADAQLFARVTGALVAITLLVPFAAMMADEGGVGFLAVPENDARGPWLTGWMQDLIVPWAAGITLWPVPVVCLIALGFALPRAAGPMFRSQARANVRPERAAAIASYATAPLAILPLAVAALWGSAIVMWLVRDRPIGAQGTLLLVFAGLLIAAVAVGGTLVRVGHWLARVRLGGLLTGVAGAVGLLGSWCGIALVLLGAVPWCFGFLWLVVDSLR